MIILGLTGSIGMGKTTTAAMFKDEGCPVFDADAAVHSLYAKGGRAVALIRAVFPDAITDGAINRARLGEHMRADPLNLTVLESFIHPMVADLRAEFFKTAAEQDADIVIMDVPLLFETGGDTYVTKTVVVTCDPKIQKQRVMARAGMNAELFKTLLGRQLPDSEKRKRADILIYTDVSLENTREQVQAVLKDLRAKP
ncbi:MAG: dephospho-CoA kinase [Maricaulaceae bacterium]